ncbi:unnamed protein product [Haemonchus placei]|uniref:Uncharacterized protein n=1 Tax=Haemonchus placei TaxID=6290 RepID=A0A3P8AZD9_HAEPC|nr:unnamed protein product [Haemonchus placei]
MSPHRKNDWFQVRIELVRSWHLEILEGICNLDPLRGFEGFLDSCIPSECKMI